MIGDQITRAGSEVQRREVRRVDVAGAAVDGHRQRRRHAHLQLDVSIARTEQADIYHIVVVCGAHRCLVTIAARLDLQFVELGRIRGASRCTNLDLA